MARWYYLASALFLLQQMEAFGIIDRLAYGEWEGKVGDTFTSSLNLLVIVTSLILFSGGLRRTKRISTGSVLLLAGVGYLLLSTLWSIDPQTTMRRGILYLFSVLGAIGIAGTLDVDEFMDVLGLTSAATAVASILLLIVSPGNATMMMGDSADFRGIFSHKSVLGMVMATGAIASLHGIRVGGRKRLRNVVFLILFTLLALLGKSATSFMMIFVFCSLELFITFFRKGGAARVVASSAMILLLPLVALATIFPDSLLELMGKDPTLTGRTELWAYVLADIAQKPLLGWGYSAFWSPNDPAAAEISTILKWYVPQAHNGLLEMLLNAGVVGTAFFIFLWVRNIWLARQCLRTPEKPLAISSFLSCAGIFLLGISETVLMDPFQITASVLFITGLMSERAVLAARGRSYTTRVRGGPAAKESGGILHRNHFGFGIPARAITMK